ncbi:MAG: hypothetical protein IJ355_08460 [Prevotella sp.]|nr:hypothetical protein [Prevotella sp.]
MLGFQLPIRDHIFHATSLCALNTDMGSKTYLIHNSTTLHQPQDGN